jgi:multidrug resistance efflux pump
MKRSLETLFALVVIAVLFGVVWTQVIAVKVEAQASPPMELGAVTVTGIVLEAGALELSVRGFGTLQAVRRVPVAVEGAGRIVSVSEKWQLGAQVPEGEVLLRLADEGLGLAVKTAEAQLAQSMAGAAAALVEIEGAEAVEALAGKAHVVAARDLRRVEQSFAKKIASEQLLDRAQSQEIAAENALELAAANTRRAKAARVTAKATVQVAEAAVAQAREARSHQDFRAPFAGRLTQAKPQVGALVAPGSAAAMSMGELLDTSELLLVAQIHEDSIARVAKGQSAVVTLPSRPGLTIAGVVRYLGVASDPVTRSLPVQIAIANDELQLPAGLFAEATISVGQLDDVMVIDRKQFLWLKGVPIAYVRGLRNGEPIAEARTLVLGDPVGEGFLVRGGLLDGETLLTSPLDRLAPRAGGGAPQVWMKDGSDGPPRKLTIGTVDGTDAGAALSTESALEQAGESK